MCGGELHGIDRELDVHVAFDLAAAGLVDEFLGRLGDDRVAVVVEPVDQRADRGIFLILDHRGVIERAQQIAARLEFAQQPLVVDVEAERLGGGVKIGAIDEQRDFFDRVRSWFSRSRKCNVDPPMRRAPGAKPRMRRIGPSLSGPISKMPSIKCSRAPVAITPLPIISQSGMPACGSRVRLTEASRPSQDKNASDLRFWSQEDTYTPTFQDNVPRCRSAEPMARVTVEDCIDKVENRFDLVLLASHRARMISSGSQITIDRDNDKNPVVALREIAETTISPGGSEGRPDPFAAEIRRSRRAGARDVPLIGGAGGSVDADDTEVDGRAHDRGRAAQGPRRPGAARGAAGRRRRNKPLAASCIERCNGPAQCRAVCISSTACAQCALRPTSNSP